MAPPRQTDGQPGHANNAAAHREAARRLRAAGDIEGSEECLIEAARSDAAAGPFAGRGVASEDDVRDSMHQNGTGPGSAHPRRAIGPSQQQISDAIRRLRRGTGGSPGY